MFRILLAAALLAGGGAHAADLVPGAQKKLDAYFDELQRQDVVSGSIAISERGITRYTRSIGFATIENGAPQPADEGTRYRIGPVGRLFTAALTMQLAESATLTLDNKVAEFFPDAPDALETSYRDLLREDGSAADDAHYLLLGRVLEKVQERPFHEILKQQVARKLGLARTYVVGTGSASTLESLSYEWRDGWQPVPQPDPATAPEAAAIVSNAGDLVTFMDALFGGKLVTRYSIGTMASEKFGLRNFDFERGRCAGERGRVAAFETFVCHFAEARISIAWTGNAARVPLDPVIEQVVDLVMKKYRPPRVVSAQ